MKMLAVMLVSYVFFSGTVMASPKEDVEKIMNAMLPFGKEILEKHGEFFPYGGAMTPEGEFVSISGYDGDEQPASQEIIDLLRDSYRRSGEEGQYIATGCSTM